jgi:hypothetical protein
MSLGLAEGKLRNSKPDLRDDPLLSTPRTKRRWKRKDFELEARLPFNRLQTLIFGFLFFSTDAEITFVFLADE